MIVNVPVDISILLAAYLCYTATDAQRNHLDDWICANDDNMRVFDACVEASLAAKVFNPDRHDEPDLGIEIELN
jgi:hypothetical protein